MLAWCLGVVDQISSLKLLLLAQQKKPRWQLQGKEFGAGLLLLQREGQRGCSQLCAPRPMRGAGESLGQSWGLR